MKEVKCRRSECMSHVSGAYVRQIQGCQCFNAGRIACLQALDRTQAVESNNDDIDAPAKIVCKGGVACHVSSRGTARLGEASLPQLCKFFIHRFLCNKIGSPLQGGDIGRIRQLSNLQ